MSDNQMEWGKFVNVASFPNETPMLLRQQLRVDSKQGGNKVMKLR